MATNNRKKQANSRRRGTDEKDSHKELLFKEDGQEYAQVLRMLGDGRMACTCYDGEARLGLIRGSMRKKKWIKVGDIVLVGLRGDESSDRKCDIIHLYSTDESRSLQAFGELPSTARINQTGMDLDVAAGGEAADNDFEFEDI